MPCNRKLSEHLLAGCDSFIQYTKQLKNKITRPRYQGTKTSNNQKRVAGHLNIVVIIIILLLLISSSSSLYVAKVKLWSSGLHSKLLYPPNHLLSLIYTFNTWLKHSDFLSVCLCCCFETRSYSVTRAEPRTYINPPSSTSQVLGLQDLLPCLSHSHVHYHCL